MTVDNLKPEDAKKIHGALKILAKHYRSAIGTAKGLSDEDGAKRYEEIADDIEQRLMPKFDDQGTLELVGK